jgi:hypothetical protein
MADESLPQRYMPAKRQDRPNIELDYLQSNDLGTIEKGIRETTKGVDFANLVVALAFAKIDHEALYAQAGCKSYLEYLDKAEDRLNMSRQTMSDYKRIGEIYMEYKSQLQQVGFREEGNLHKLRYLPRALEQHPPREVFNRLVRDSLRKFAAYASPSSDDGRSAPVRQYVPHIEITDRKISVDGKNILRFDPALRPELREELTGYLVKIYEVRATGNKPYILNVYDEKEAQAVERYLQRHRMRK